MFEYLKPFTRIIVTGPQRSGTRVCAKMISADTGLRYVDEQEINVDSLYALAHTLTEGNVVIQCPALSYWAWAVGTVDDVAIVLMRRPVVEIIASQERVRWGYEWLELMRYGAASSPIAEVKYRFWDETKDRIRHPFEVEYESLKAHPLWIDKEARAGFGYDQTEAVK